MPWWFWILLWVALVAVSLLFYFVLGVRLFRKFMATVKDLGAAGDKLGHVGPLHGADLQDRQDSMGRPAAGSAVFASPADMRHDYEASKSSRREERRLRRVQRKKDRGQPQALTDLDFT
ncbi:MULTISPECIES: hypothetical protein [Micrococcaceae]|uniref:hypothetical protein n=1 Tax=Micrococcaceae TaxID=1268 RepID=UPI0006FEF327|nr:hypothetical protein [Arthrobacter sp. Leaf137]KQQ85296.1 hypothetical protein ASF64_04005 [Arthrobacter sp. Leaf137]MDQ1055957.1 hypothetical protein [Arthrobacter sp. SORGH_AS_0212]